MALEGIDAWPLTWPDGWQRTPVQFRSKYQMVAFDQARKHIIHSLQKMGVQRKDVVISTNLPLRKDGEPYGDARCQGTTGVAVYWMRNNKPQVMACDRWLKVGENARAIWHALEALRALERCGASQILERAYMGFAALPVAGHVRDWRQVLGAVGVAVDFDVIEQLYREQALLHHPDRGGSQERMAEVNRAFQDAKLEYGR